MKVKKLQGPRGLFPFGNLFDFLRYTPWELVDKYYQRYGKVFKASIGPQKIVFMLDYKGAQEIFISKSPDYYKAMPTTCLIPTLGSRALFINNGTQWRIAKDNSLLSHDKKINSFLSGHEKVLQEKFPKLVEKYKLDILDCNFEEKSFYLFADLIGIITSGNPLPSNILKSFIVLTKYADWSIKYNIPVVTPRFYKHRRIWRKYWEDQVDNATGGMIKEFAMGNPLNFKEFAQNLSNYYWGGIFSINSIFINCLHQLSTQPEVFKEIRRGNDKMLQAAINETLRLKPAVPLYGRNVLAPETQLMDLKLKKGTTVLFSCRPFHLDKDNWENPNSFLPHRWLKEEIDINDYQTEKFMPFGLGQRSCPGRDMSLFILKVILKNIVNNYELDFKDNDLDSNFFFGCQVPVNVTGGLIPNE